MPEPILHSFARKKAKFIVYFRQQLWEKLLTRRLGRDDPEKH